MKKENCIFCMIVEGKIPSIKIWEDDLHIAILDINPNVEGMTLVLTKEHYDSYAFKMKDDEYSNFMIAAKKVSGLLEKGLDVKRVALVMEGLGVDHAHLKLYPIHGLDEEFRETWAKEKIYFDKYLGYISTQLGPQRTPEELKKVAQKILSKEDKNGRKN